MSFLEQRVKYPQPYSVRIPKEMNECEADYLRNYIHHQAKYNAKHKKSKWEKRLDDSRYLK